MKRKILSLILSLLLVAGIETCIYGGAVQAISKGEKAKKAYARILSDVKAADGIIYTGQGLGENTKFALIDLNQDGVFELIFTPDDGYRVDIVSYVNGKTKSVGYGFSGTQKYYPKKHIYFSHMMHTGGDVYTYYKFTGKKMKVIAEKYGNDMVNAITGKEKTGDDVGKFAPYKYTVKGKIASGKRYNSYIKKLLSNTKNVKLKWHKNTEKNRKLYL